MATKKKKGKQKESALSPELKKGLTLATLVLLVVVGGGWAYVSLTTVPPPAISTAPPSDVAGFLAHPRGFARMPVDAREKFLADAILYYNESGKHNEFAGAIQSLSTAERKVVQDAVFDIGRVRYMEQAREFNKTSPKNRRQFVDKAMSDWNAMRAKFGGGSGGQNLADPFKGDLPTTQEGWTKMIVTRTTPRERAEGEQFFNALAARHQELEGSR